LAPVRDGNRGSPRTTAAILLITGDMPERIALADRIAVMDDWRIKGEFANTRDYNAMGERIMALIHARDAA
jgi:ribose transport system ATP-binding protein